MFEFDYSVNRQGKDKDFNFEKLTVGFKRESGTIYDVADVVSQGFALCAGIFNGRRQKRNFIKSNWILIDIDNSESVIDADGKLLKDENGKTVKRFKHEMSIEEALEHPFIRKHCAFIYTTASSTPEWEKFRLVFVLSESVYDIDTYEGSVKYFHTFLPNDPACKDALRVFYGASKGECKLIQDVTLPSEIVTKAKEFASAAKEQRKVDAAKASAKAVERQLKYADANQRTPEQVLNLIDPNRLDWESWRNCLLAAHHENVSEIDALLWSNRSGNHTDRGFYQVWKCIKRATDKSLTIGTLYHYAKQQGWKPEPNPSKKIINRKAFVDSLEVQIDNKIVKSDQVIFTFDSAETNLPTVKASDSWFGDYSLTYARKVRKAIEHFKGKRAIVKGVWQDANRVSALGRLVRQLGFEICFSIDSVEYSFDDFYKEAFSRKQKEIIKAECDRLSALTHQPTQKINERFLPKFTELSKTKQLIAVSSATGSGKTERVKDLMKLTLAMNPERQVYNLSYRNALSTDTAQRLGLAHLHTVGKDFFKYKNKSCCVDSIHKLALDEIGYADLLVIDEVEAFINHLVNGSTVKARRGEILRQFISFVQMIIRKGGFVVIMEADLSDVSIDFFRAIIGESVGMELIVNEYETIRYPVTFVQSKKSDCLVDLMTETLEAGEKFLFVSNSQRECERVHKILEKRFDVAMFRIDGKTSETEEAKAVLADLNGQIESQKLFVLILSPSLESGGNIKSKRFSKVFGSFVNTDVRRAVQMLNRLRTDVPRFVHAKDNQQIAADSHTLNVNAFKASLLANETETARVCRISKQENVKDLVFDLAKAEGSNWLQSAPLIAKADSSSELGFVLDTAIKLQVRSNCSMVNLEQNLMDRFERLAFDVSIVEMDASEAVKQAVKEVKKEIKEADIEERYLAGSWMDEATALEVKNNPQSVREDRITADQSLLNLRYNGEIELDRDKLNFVYVKDDGKTINKLRFLVRCQNVEKSLIKERKYQEKFADALLTDKRHDHIKVKFIAEVFPMLLRLIDSSEMFNGESEVAQQILRLAKQHRIEIKQYFGLNITDETTANQCISKLAKTLFGLKLQSKRIGGRKDQAYFYWFDLPSDEIYYDFWQAETKLIRKEHYSAKPTKRIESIEYQKPEPVIEQLRLVA